MRPDLAHVSSQEREARKLTPSLPGRVSGSFSGFDSLTLGLCPVCSCSTRCERDAVER